MPREDAQGGMARGDAQGMFRGDTPLLYYAGYIKYMYITYVYILINRINPPIGRIN